MWTSRVVRQAKYAPPPPPITNPDMVLYHRPTTYDLDDYKGGYGPVIPQETPEQSLRMTFNSEKEPLGIWTQILSYLQTQNVSLNEGIIYLDQIAQAKISFPDLIQKILQETGEKFKDVRGRPEQELLLFGLAANQLQLYIPKHLLMSPGLAYFFYTSLYWMRSPSRPPITLKDLYLVTANPFDRYPARKLLSYYRDPELYYQLGRSENLYFPKSYSHKRQQLDGLVAFSLAQYGYYSVKSWSRPIRITWNVPMKSVSLPGQVLSTEVTLEEIMKRPNLPAQRLAIQVESSWPWLKDQESWQKFLDWSREQVFTEELRSSEPVDQVPDSMISLEENFNICLICLTQRPDRDFALCGHAVCSVCQPLLRTPKCPFCHEHFTCESLDNVFIERMRTSVESSIDLQGNIRQALQLKNNRRYSFDWSSMTT